VPSVPRPKTKNSAAIMQTPIPPNTETAGPTALLASPLSDNQPLLTPQKTKGVAVCPASASASGVCKSVYTV
jgi:hypothetical protein